MSGCSYDTICPKCGNKKMHSYSDYKPHDSVAGECLKCGFAYYTTETQLSLKEVNELRRDFEMKKLTKLAKERKDI